MGEPVGTLKLALDRLRSVRFFSGFVVSRIIATDPVGGESGQSQFANAVASFYTKIPPQQTLETLLAIESELGRTRSKTWEARTIDLDLLAYDKCVMQTETLTLPHPRLTVRRFVVDPLAEIAPRWEHPQLGWTMAHLKNHLMRQERLVQLGKSFQIIKNHPDLFRKLEQFQAVYPGWSFQEKTHEPFMDVCFIRDFMRDLRWTAPRFFPTSDSPDVLVDQLLAICRGLT